MLKVLGGWVVMCSRRITVISFMFFFFQAEDGIRDHCVTGVQTCALPISGRGPALRLARSTRSVDIGMSQDRRVPRRSPLGVTRLGGHFGAPMLDVGALIVGLVIVAALGAPLLATTDPVDQDLTVVLKPPFWLEDGSLQHPLGTDHLGRDVYSRLI